MTRFVSRRLALLAAPFVLALIGWQAPAAAEEIAAGTFEGRSDHVVTGGVTLSSDGTIALADDFELDGAPDPVVAFGHAGDSEPSAVIAPLDDRTGAQNYSLPSDVDPASVTQVWIWCGEFSVPLGHAMLSAE